MCAVRPIDSPWLSLYGAAAPMPLPLKLRAPCVGGSAAPRARAASRPGAPRPPARPHARAHRLPRRRASAREWRPSATRRVGRRGLPPPPRPGLPRRGRGTRTRAPRAVRAAPPARRRAGRAGCAAPPPSRSARGTPPAPRRPPSPPPRARRCRRAAPRRRRPLEGRVRVDRPRHADKGLTPLGGSRVEQLQGAAQAPAGDTGERCQFLLAELWRVLADRLLHRGLRETPERDELAARANRLGQRAEPLGDEDDDGVRRRFLEVFEERVRGVLVQRVGAEHEVDTPLALERAHVQVAAQLAHVVDPNLLAERLEQVEVGMSAALDARVVAEQLRREAARELPLA